MYVNCWVTRNMGIVDLAQQRLVNVVTSSDLPAAGSLADKQNRGRHFYFTGRGRWSNGGEGWSSCGSCHPDGLSDNITWRFGAGPRQSTSMDGSFSHGTGGVQKQRIFNWSGIFDEQHDFERNTRGVSGGIGALVKNTDLLATSRLSLDAVAGTEIGGLAKPLKELQDGTAGGTSVDTGPSVLKDWDEIDEFVKTIRPPKARQTLDPISISAGASLFQEGRCANCHGGQGWTLSRRFFIPSSATNLALTTTAFTGAANLLGGSKHTVEIAAEPNPAGGTVAPAQVACVLRDV
jgi:mono/diheme cytochrome c family protein